MLDVSALTLALASPGILLLIRLLRSLMEIVALEILAILVAVHVRPGFARAVDGQAVATSPSLQVKTPDVWLVERCAGGMKPQNLSLILVVQPQG
jgi:hypothetical protein